MAEDNDRSTQWDEALTAEGGGELVADSLTATPDVASTSTRLQDWNEGRFGFGGAQRGQGRFGAAPGFRQGQGGFGFARGQAGPGAFGAGQGLRGFGQGQGAGAMGARRFGWGQGAPGSGLGPGQGARAGGGGFRQGWGRAGGAAFNAPGTASADASVVEMPMPPLQIDKETQTRRLEETVARMEQRLERARARLQALRDEIDAEGGSAVATAHDTSEG